MYFCLDKQNESKKGLPVIRQPLFTGKQQPRSFAFYAGRRSGLFVVTSCSYRVPSSRSCTSQRDGKTASARCWSDSDKIAWSGTSNTRMPAAQALVPPFSESSTAQVSSGLLCSFLQAVRQISGLGLPCWISSPVTITEKQRVNPDNSR